MTKVPKYESQTVEFKDFSGGISFKELSNTMCAFANSDGGSIYIGVTDNVRLTGIKITPEHLDIIQNAAREGCVPSVQISLATLNLKENLSILQVKVLKSSHLHSIQKGYTYIRIGTQDKKIIGDELLRLAETKSQTSFEDHLLTIGLEAIDLNIVQNYQASRTTTNSLSSEELLLKLGFARRTGGKTYLTVGGFILFGKQNHPGLLQRDFQFIVYEHDNMYTYREELSLPAALIANRLMELLTPYIKKTTGTSGMKREDHIIYPEAAIREVVLNAIIHRDYRISGLKNELRVFPDRIEIISAGQLPPIINLENIYDRHYSRNPKITHALMISGLVEELGQGIKLMGQALSLNNNPPPLFQENTDQFKVTFYRQKITTQGSIGEQLFKYFSDNKLLSRKQLEVLTGLSSTSIKNGITTLILQDKIIKVGKGPATRYKLVKK